MSDGIEDKSGSSDLVTGRRYFDVDLEVKVVYRESGRVYEGRRSLSGRVDLTETDKASETMGRERKYPRGGCQI
ncbi:MAG TPA: hypothetical protein VJC07_05010 [Candidatus Nanoarchaeia archaeon]|nr:hypothetical protein [Candidatus Nanoarchaeia archaeon]